MPTEQPPPPVIYVAWDIETTGFKTGANKDKEPDEIINIGWTATKPGDPLIAGETFALPVNAKSHPKAESKHGITPAFLRNRGAEDLEKALTPFIGSICALPRVVLVAHNGYKFDSCFLRGALKTCDMELPPSVEGFVDTMKVQNLNLDCLAHNLGVSTEQRAVFHRALADAQVLAEVFEKMFPENKPTIGHAAYESVEHWKERTALIKPPPSCIEKIVRDMLNDVVERVTQKQRTC